VVALVLVAVVVVVEQGDMLVAVQEYLVKVLMAPVAVQVLMAGADQAVLMDQPAPVEHMVEGAADRAVQAELALCVLSGEPADPFLVISQLIVKV
jgi:hypothetical protein